MIPEIWVIAPKQRGQPDPEVCATIRAECQRRGWPDSVLVRPLADRNSAGRPVALLRPDEANKLYRALHRARLGVFATGDVFARLDPTRHIRDEKWLAGVSRLVRYKGFYARVSPPNLGPTIEAFAEWLSASHCEGERDPRALPLHSFCPEMNCSELESENGRADFNATYGPPTRRVCERRMVWTPDPSHHGGAHEPPLNVAGLPLTEGMHWDVMGQKRSKPLLTLTTVWLVPHRGHINVYPDGYVRGGKDIRRVTGAS
jgi:hypothetical protein